MPEVYKTKVMIGKTKNGLNKYWSGSVFEEDGSFFYETFSWQEKQDGENSLVVSSGQTPVKGKNIGKKNETTPLQQGIFNVESKLRKKIDEGYVYIDGTPIEKEDFCLPMLAGKYEFGQKKKLEYPVFLQPKYNGVRCLFNGDKFWSRKGKEYTTCNHLSFDTDGYTVDGELLLPMNYTFQQTISAVKKQTELSNELIYVLYDVVVPEATYSERKEILKTIGEKNNFCFNSWGDLPESKINICPTILIESEEELQDKHNELSSSGWEGTIVRFADNKYIDKRSSSLLKVKDFEDAEFEITGFFAGENGNEQGCIIFVCLAENGETFNVRPAETFKNRRKMFDDGNQFVGKQYTVKFKGRSDSGIPIFPVGISVRDE